MDFEYRTFYLVRSYDGYDNYWSIDGIFLSKDSAEAYAKKLREVGCDADIEDYDVPTDCIFGSITLIEKQGDYCDK